MNLRFFNSLRVRLMMLVFLGTIPFLVLLLYSNYELRKQVTEDVQHAAMNRVTILAHEQQYLVKNTRQLLFMLSQIPQIQTDDPTVCNSFLANVLEANKTYANFGVIELNGDINCSAIPFKKAVNTSDRSYFKRTLASRSFAVGDYQVGRITHIAVLVFSHPVFDEHKQLKAVLFAALPLSWLTNHFADSAFPSGSVINVIDHSTHRLLAQYPESTVQTGSFVGTTPLVEAMHATNSAGVSTTTGFDGVARLYAFNRLQNLPDGKKINVSIGIPEAVAYKNSNNVMTRNLIFLFIVVALMLLFAWYGSDRLILRQVTELLGVTRQLASGNLNARVEVPHRGNEIMELGHEFNKMANVLEKHESESMQADYLLRKSEEKLRNIIDMVPDILYTAAVTGNFRGNFVSPGITPLLGYTPEEFMKESDVWAGAVHDDDRQRVFAEVQDALENLQDDFNLEYRIWHKNGKLFKWVEDHGHISRDGAGKPTLIHGVMIDITRHKLMEEALRDSEERFRSITVTAQDAVLVLNDLGKLTYWNPAAERIFGYSEAEVLEKDVHLLLGAERYHEAYKKGFQKFCKTGNGPVVGKTLELEAVRKGGETFPIELSVSAAKLGGKWHAVGILRDITERKQQEDKLRKTTRALSAIHASNFVLTRSTDEKQLFEGVCQNIIKQAGYQFVWIGLVQPDAADIVIPAAWSGEEFADIKSLDQCRRDDEPATCPALKAIQTGTSYIEMDIREASDSNGRIKQAAQAHYGSVLGIPLFEGELAFGALTIYSNDANAFEVEEVALLEELANDVAYGVTALRAQQKHQKAEETIIHQAFHDSLTDLPNRTMMMQSLDKAIEHVRHTGGAAAVLFIDLDDFKLVNDTFGHTCGDELLRQVATRLERATRGTDIVARQGGDEFIVLVTRYGKQIVKSDCMRAAAIVAERILADLHKPFQLKQQDVYVSGSIGISLFPSDGDNTNQLIQHADSAMYRAKELGRGNYQYFSQELSNRQQKKMSLATMLHKAIEQQEFTLYYQPIIDLANGKMVGVEALIRWQHEKNKLMSPDDFLPVAEDTGLIVPIGEWVIEEACQQLQDWNDKGISLMMAVNLSVQQMWRDDIANLILNIIDKEGIARDMLEFEITESAMVLDPQRMDKTLQHFNNSGIKISLDDFGTGYSSLDRLKHLPFNKLKVDKSFVDGIPGDKSNVAIVTATVQMVRSLGISSLAEGIETVEQYRFLKHLGCDYAQGYYFSRPVPAAEIEDMVRQNQSWQL
jgi:diguanylate cyclase (GGDEF)-like protein/PAS domain S-box-containing protein